MKKILLLAVVLMTANALSNDQHTVIPIGVAVAQGDVQADAQLAEAFAKHISHQQVTGQGVVAKLFPDDNEGSRHQRFILKLGSGQTLLMAHNIDIAPRIDALREGDVVLFQGEYEWNEKGGVVHWTHHTPSGAHPNGWLEHQGKKYQ